MSKQKILFLLNGADDFSNEILNRLSSSYSESFDVQKFDAHSLSYKKNKVFGNEIENPQSSPENSFYNHCKKLGGHGTMKFLTKLFFGEQFKNLLEKIKTEAPNFVFTTNYFCLAVALDYKKKFNRTCRIFALNTELINHKWWNHKDYIYIVNNETAYIDAIGKKRHSPALVRQVTQKPPEKYSRLILEKQNQEPGAKNAFCVLVDSINEKTYKIIKKLIKNNVKLNIFAFFHSSPRERNLYEKLKMCGSKTCDIQLLDFDAEENLKYFALADVFLSDCNYREMKLALYSATPILIYSKKNSKLIERLFIQDFGCGLVEANINNIVRQIEEWTNNPDPLFIYRENALKICSAESGTDDVVQIIVDESKNPVIDIDKNDYTNMLYELAAQEKYDTYTTPINFNSSKELMSYDQLRKSNIFSKSYKLILKSVIRLFGPILDYVGFRIKIEGRKNLKGIKSGITISNHVHYLDCLWNMQALSRKRHVYITGAPFNFKKGFFGASLKAGGFIPIATSFSQKKEFDKYLSDIFAKGGIVHFYPEQAMWLRYEQSRPLKKGAFFYASKNNVPIIPMVICFRKAKFLKNKAVTVKICSPIYPDANLSQAENAKMMNERAQQEYDEAIIEFYHYDRETYAMNEINEKNSQKTEKNNQ